MMVFIFFAMALSLEHESTPQMTDCKYLREQCLSDANGCKYAWRLMEDSCNVSGNLCKMKDSSNCNLSIQSLVESNFQFEDCLCTDNL
uniref:GDNF/GAS1 domain-containing protein n=1 Tax=Mustela putorius furo TaxID=9669 RepID=M3XUP5_MUSPF